jgi:hypothetical protein
MDLRVAGGTCNLIYKKSATYFRQQIATSRLRTNQRFAPRNDVLRLQSLKFAKNISLFSLRRYVKKIREIYLFTKGG